MQVEWHEQQHREQGEEPGYFALLLSPKRDWEDGEIQPRAITFVLDVSGVVAKKRAAIRCYASQLRYVDYEHVIVGLLTGNIREGARAKLSHYGLFDEFAFGGEDQPDAVRKIEIPERVAFLGGDGIAKSSTRFGKRGTGPGTNSAPAIVVDGTMT